MENDTYRRGRDSSPLGDPVQASRDRSRSPPRRHASPGREGGRPPPMSDRRFSRGRDDHRDSYRGDTYGRYVTKFAVSIKGMDCSSTTMAYHVYIIWKYINFITRVLMHTLKKARESSRGHSSLLEYDTVTFVFWCRHDRYGGGRRGGRYGGRGPMTFREFMEGLPNSATPEYAKAEYDRYMADYYGDELKAEFERKKGDPELRKRYHPKEIQKSLEEKFEAARAAAEFVSEKGLPSWRFLPVGPYHYEKLKKDGEDMAPTEAKREDFRRAYPVTDDRRAQYLDFKVAKRLVKKLDSECGIESNPMLPLTGGLEEPEEEEEEEVLAGKSNADEDDEDDADEMGHDEEVDKMEEDKKEEGHTQDNADSTKYDVHDESFNVQQLDDLLQYLWIVHGIDYYACKEYGFENDYARRIMYHRRVLRPNQINAMFQDTKMEGEKDKDESTKDAEVTEPVAEEPYVASLMDLKIHDSKVCNRWRKRISSGPPSAKFIKANKVEEELEGFIERQIVKHEENKWGNKLSNKLFVAKEFVVKHIKNKHAHVLDAEREKITESIYRENYIASKEKEQKRTAGRGGRGGRFGGRGGRGGISGNQMMYIDFGGRGQMTPVMVMPVGGNRGGRGGFRGGRGGRGRFGGQGYYDLDAPQNNRSMLDYGDL